jgi:hypothetical protein
MFLCLLVISFDFFVFAKTKTSKVTTCKDKNIKGYNLQRQKHQRLQPAKTKTSMVTICKDKNINGYNLQTQKNQRL